MVVHLKRDLIYWYVKGYVPLLSVGEEGSQLYTKIHLFMKRLNQRLGDILLMDADSFDILYQMERQVIDAENKS